MSHAPNLQSSQCTKKKPHPTYSGWAGGEPEATVNAIGHQNLALFTRLRSLYECVSYTHPTASTHVKLTLYIVH